MKVEPDAHFELAPVRTPAGQTEIVVKMTAGDKELAGATSRDELRFLRQAIGELLNTDERAGRLPAFPAPPEPTRLDKVRRRLWTPGA